MLSANDVAHHFLIHAREVGELVTHLKLQKLCYFAQAYHLAMTDTPLFDGDLEAWEHGPVSPEIWREYRYTRTPLSPPPDLLDPVQDAEELEFLGIIGQKFGPYSAVQLRNLSHRTAPWREAWARAGSGGDPTITPESMADYFRTRIHELDTAEASPLVSHEEARRILTEDDELVRLTEQGLDAVRAGKFMAS